MFFVPTKAELLARVRWESEPKDGHRGDQETRDDQVGEVVQGSPPDFDHKGDVKVRLGTTVVNDLVPISRNS